MPDSERPPDIESSESYWIARIYALETEVIALQAQRNVWKLAWEKLSQAALAVGRLNYDQPDSIRPRTHGAVDAFHRLEDVLAELGLMPLIPKEDP
jgi:hypothetical protein